MIKNIIISALSARVLMMYIFTIYTKTEAVWLFGMLTAICFILIAMIEDWMERSWKRTKERRNKSVRGSN